MLKYLLTKKRTVAPVKKINIEVPNFEHFPTIDDRETVSPGGKFRATFTLRIVRNSDNIAQPLEVGILGAAQVLSGYTDLITLPAATTLDVTGGIYNNLVDRYRFTYTNGANIDTIDVFCSELLYPAFLGNSIVDRYRINNIRYMISDPTIQAQFSNAMIFCDTGIFGLKKENPLVPGSFINPQDQKNNILDIPIGEGFDKEKCIIHAIQPVAGFEVSMMFFVEFSDKYTAAAVGL